MVIQSQHPLIDGIVLGAVPEPLPHDAITPDDSWFTDLRPMLNTRLQALEKEQGKLLEQRAELEASLVMLKKDIETVREMALFEARRLGETNSITETSDLRFLSMRLSDIAGEFLQQHRSKSEMVDHLESINYPFKSDSHGKSVHFAWVNAMKRQT